jgi:hypothetical protein
MKHCTMLALASAAIAMPLAAATPEYGRKDGAAPGPADELSPPTSSSSRRGEGRARAGPGLCHPGRRAAAQGRGIVLDRAEDQGRRSADQAQRLEALSEQVTALEQKAARAGSAPEREKSAGYKFIEDEGVKAFLANPSGGKRVGVDVKAIISSLTTAADGSAGDLIVPDRRRSSTRSCAS